jgi:hypothetical protein
MTENTRALYLYLDKYRDVLFIVSY